MHVINQIVKGNLYFRFKTKRIVGYQNHHYSLVQNYTSV